MAFNAFKCRVCGNDTFIDEGNGVVRCPVCDFVCVMAAAPVEFERVSNGKSVPHRCPDCGGDKFEEDESGAVRCVYCKRTFVKGL